MKTLLIAVFLFYGNTSHSQVVSKLASYKLYGAYGLPMYFGHARPYSLPRSDDDYGTEWTSGYRVGFYKTFNNFWEIGVNYGNQKINGIKDAGTSWGAKSIFEAEVKEYGLTCNYSINENLYLTNDRFSYNVIMGLGAIQYSSAFSRFNPSSTTIDKIMWNSVGLGRKPTPAHVYDKAIAYYLQLGLGMFFKVSPRIILSVENTFQILSTKNLASDGNSNPNITTYDTYNFTAIGIGFRLAPIGSRRMKCRVFS